MLQRLFLARYNDRRLLAPGTPLESTSRRTLCKPRCETYDDRPSRRCWSSDARGRFDAIGWRHSGGRHSSKRIDHCRRHSQNRDQLDNKQEAHTSCKQHNQYNMDLLPDLYGSITVWCNRTGLNFALASGRKCAWLVGMLRAIHGVYVSVCARVRARVCTMRDRCQTRVGRWFHGMDYTTKGQNHTTPRKRDSQACGGTKSLSMTAQSTARASARSHAAICAPVTCITQCSERDPADSTHSLQTNAHASYTPNCL
jgi:hypothetical protein